MFPKLLRLVGIILVMIAIIIVCTGLSKQSFSWIGMSMPLFVVGIYLEDIPDIVQWCRERKHKK